VTACFYACVKLLVSRPTRRTNIEGGRENGNDQNTIFGPNRAEVTRKEKLHNGEQ
jgi:hypothetical protein